MTTPSDLNIYQLIDTQNGRVTPRIYTDPDIYQLEQGELQGRGKLFPPLTAIAMLPLATW